MKNIIPVFSVALKEAKIDLKDISAIAYTNGPGLMGPLMVGSSFAKGLSISTGLPLIPVNHMEAHVLAHYIEDPKPEHPFLCLTASGGHTQLVLTDGSGLKLIGETMDDAAGEAFDKIGKMLGLDYPAGPQIDELAQSGDSKRFEFPVFEMEGLNYSFSGLKTNVLYFLQKEMKADPGFIEKNKADLAASVQKTIVDTLILKLRKGAKKHAISHLGIAGGVAANSELKSALIDLCDQHSWTPHILDTEYCTDNAAMIAMVGELKLQQGIIGAIDDVPSARLKF